MITSNLFQLQFTKSAPTRHRKFAVPIRSGFTNPTNWPRKQLQLAGWMGWDVPRVDRRSLDRLVIIWRAFIASWIHWSPPLWQAIVRRLVIIWRAIIPSCIQKSINDWQGSKARTFRAVSWLLRHTSYEHFRALGTRVKSRHWYVRLVKQCQ